LKTPDIGQELTGELWVGLRIFRLGWVVDRRGSNRLGMYGCMGSIGNEGKQGIVERHNKNIRRNWFEPCKPSKGGGVGGGWGGGRGELRGTGSM